MAMTVGVGGGMGGPLILSAAAQVKQNELNEASRQWNLQWDEYLKQMAAQQANAGQVGGGLSSLVSQYNQSFAEAKAAEDARYNQMLGLTDQATGQRAADIRSEYGNQTSNAMQDLARLGMGNTTVAPTLAAGYKREEQSALNRLTDQMLGTKLGVMQGKKERYPETDIIKTLVQVLGQNSAPKYGSGPVPLLAPGSGSGAGGIASTLGPMKL